MIPRLLIGRCAALAVLVAALAPPAIAQPAQRPAQLPDELITATSVAARQAEVQAFAQEWIDDLSASDPVVRQAARDALLQPLTGAPEPTRAFRLAYGSALGDELVELVGHADPGAALAALRIAGLLASEEGHRAIQQGLSDERAAVRYAAAAALGDLFRLASRNAAALPGRLLDDAVQRAQSRLEREASPLVVDRLLLSFLEPGFGTELRARTLLAAARGGAVRFRAWREEDRSDPQTLAAAARAITAVRSELIRLLGQGAADRDFAAVAGVLGGHALSYALDVQSRLGWPEDSESLLPSIAESAQGVIALAEQTRGRDPFDPNLVRDRTGVRRDGLMQWIGPRGALTAPPYGEPSEGFLAGLDGR